MVERIPENYIRAALELKAGGAFIDGGEVILANGSESLIIEPRSGAVLAEIFGIEEDESISKTPYLVVEDADVVNAALRNKFYSRVKESGRGIVVVAFAEHENEQFLVFPVESEKP
jgi:hypothetical protein